MVEDLRNIVFIWHCAKIGHIQNDRILAIRLNLANTLDLCRILIVSRSFSNFQINLTYPQVKMPEKSRIDLEVIT